ncbi:sigma-70 family RNA polymerase sigma factor [Vibrio sp. RC27]
MDQTELRTATMKNSQTGSITKTTSLHSELSLWLRRVAEDQDKVSFTKLFKFFAPKIKNFGIKQFNNEAQANDLVQETMTNVWKKAHLYDDSKGAATTWIYTVMRNASFDYLRKQKSRDEQMIGDDIWPIENALANDLTHPNHTVFPDHLLSKQVEKLVINLPQDQQAVLRGVYFQQLSQEQLSKQLGVPLGTVKSRLRLALEKIRSQMGEDIND